MKIIETIILGIIQGIAEFLPISSSAHLIIFRDVFGIGSFISGKSIRLQDISYLVILSVPFTYVILLLQYGIKLQIGTKFPFLAIYPRCLFLAS